MENLEQLHAASLVMSAAKDQNGVSLGDRSNDNPVLLVFLRHFGCTFCREAVSQIAENITNITKDGTVVAFVHMGTESQAEKFFAKYKLQNSPRFSDPGKRMYEAFGLERGTMAQLFGPKVVMRGFGAFFSGHGIGPLVGDGLQMPGTFLVYRGGIVKSFVNATAGDIPNYAGMAKCDVPACNPA